MAVKSTPVQHEEVDFADMCARLQHQLSTVEGQVSAKLNEQAEKYEKTIRNLKEQIQSNGGASTRPHDSPSMGLGAQESPSLAAIMSYLEGNSTWDGTEGLSWFKAASWIDENGTPTEGTEASVLLAYCFDALKKMFKATSALIEDSKLREKEQEENLVKLLGEVAVKENKAELEKMAMANCDPTRHLDSFNFVGSHLAQVSKGNAFTRIKEMYGLEGESVHEREEAQAEKTGKKEGKVLKDITDYKSAKELAMSIDFMTSKLASNVDILYGNIDKKDLVLGNLKTDLMSQMAEKRSREEEVVNWSYILKYLLATTSKLRAQLLEEQQRYATALQNSPQKRMASHTTKGLKADMLKVTNTSDDEDDEEYAVPPRAPVQNGIGTSSSLKGKDRNNKRNARNDEASIDKALRKAEAEAEEKRSPEQNFHLRNIAAANSDITSGNGIREERKRLSQAGKLGPRLQNSKSAVSHNAAVTSEVDQIGPPPSSYGEDMYSHQTPQSQYRQDLYYDDDNVSMNDSEAAGSFRSAATVNSIPPYSTYQRKSSRPSSAHRERGGPPLPPPPPPESPYQSDSIPSSENFAKNVVQGLGVVGQEADAAMTVIDRVSKMTNYDIARLDAETRQQVMQIRLELGIMDVDDKLSKPVPRNGNGNGGYGTNYRSALPSTGMHTPSSNVTMSDVDDDTFSQLDDDENWR